MELLGDVVHVESRFVLFGDSVSIGARQVHGLSPLVPQAEKSFWTNPMVLLGDGGQVEARFSTFEDVLVLVQDRCTVCAKQGSEIISEAPDGTPM